MAPTHSRTPSLPCIPDVDFDFDEKCQLLPELDMLSLTGCDDAATLDEESHSQISRSRSTRTAQFELQPHRIPIRFPSSSSSSSTYGTLPLSTRCTDLTFQTQLQLPASQKTVLESWTITYHQPTTHTTSWYHVLGITWWRRTQREEGSILSVVPNAHFSQAELASTTSMHETAIVTRSNNTNKTASSKGAAAAAAAAGSNSVYATDLEARLRGLDWKVQDEIYELLSDRVQSSSTAFRRREWRVVVMSEVPGGEMTDAPTGHGQVCGGKLRKWKTGKMGRRGPRGVPDMPITEYRLILRGTETKKNEQGWGCYNRYSRPWRAADEKEIGERRRWSGMTGRSEKYVDF